MVTMYQVRALILTLVLPFVVAPLVSGELQPNIILIVADDLGFGDIGPYGSSSNRTPHLDRLAREGLRFTDFHSNGPMCTPTRVALLTGLYQQRFGRIFESALGGRNQYDNGLPLAAETIAEVLQESGYTTAMYGKWHLGYHPPLMPFHQGFDDFRGLASGGGDHHSHIDRSGRKDWWHNDRIEMESGYATDLITKHSVDFIEHSVREIGRPFFLYIPHLAIHFPWQTPDDSSYRIEGGDYWDLSKLGRHTTKNMASKVKRMVEAVDSSLGRILTALHEQNIAEQTLLIFTSDNGGYITYPGGFHNISSNGPLRGQKTDVYEGGHRVPTIAWWPGRIRPGVSDEITMSFDLFPTFAATAGLGAAISSKLDGVNLLPLLLEGAPIAARTLFWRMRDRRAVRQGRWKLVEQGLSAPQLFDLSVDISEVNDLATQRPRLVKDLLAKLAAWENEVEHSSDR